MSPTSLLDTDGWPDLLDVLRTSRRDIRTGGGRRGIDRQHAKGRLTARERIEALIDPSPEFFELHLFAGFERFLEWGGAPSAGMVTGIGWIEGRPTVIVANDATVKAGAFFPTTTKKLLRAQTVAAENRLPLVYLVDSSGVFLPLQDEIFPDQDDFGRIFYNNARISANGIPQIAAIMGNCVAGGAYLPVMCDKILMTEGSGLYIAGPALVKAAIGQQIASDELGGAGVHARLSGTIDFREADDEQCLERMRRLIDAMGIAKPRTAAAAVGIEAPSSTLERLPLPWAGAWGADAVLDTFLDKRPGTEAPARGVRCVRGSVSGLKVAVVVNASEGKALESADLEATLGFLKRSEKAGLATLFVRGAESWQTGCCIETELIHHLATSPAPRLLLITGGDVRPGQLLPCGKSLEPRLILAWPTAYASGWVAEEKEFDIRHAEARLGVDRIIEPSETREALAVALAVVGS